MTETNATPKSIDVSAATKRLFEAQKTIQHAEKKAQHYYGRMRLIHERLEAAKTVMSCVARVEAAGGSTLQTTTDAAIAEMSAMLAEYPEAVRLYTEAVAELEASLDVSKSVGQEVEAEVKAATKAIQDSMTATPAATPAEGSPPN